MQRVSRELERLLTVTALMTDPVIACDECGQMVYANFAAKTLFGEIDMEKNSMDDCPEALGIFDCMASGCWSRRNCRWRRRPTRARWCG